MPTIDSLNFKSASETASILVEFVTKNTQISGDFQSLAVSSKTMRISVTEIPREKYRKYRLVTFLSNPLSNSLGTAHTNHGIS